MKFYKIIIVAASVLVLVACSTSKEISYFQDLRPGESELTLAAPMEIKIQPKDKLSILVNSQDLRLTNLFNLPIVSQQVGQESSSGTNRGVSGYTVDSKGDIDFPVLGGLHVQGMTREEVAVYIGASIYRTTDPDAFLFNCALPNFDIKNAYKNPVLTVFWGKILATLFA